MNILRHAALALLLGAFAATPGRAETASPRVIEVTGEAMREVAPDLAFVRLGVTLENEDLATSLDETSARMRKLIDTATAQGIAPADITTNALQIMQEDERRNQNGKWTETGRKIYRTTQELRIGFRDLPALGKNLRELLGQGATTLRGIEFTLARPQDHAAPLRLEAVADARTQAETLARAAGVELGEILRITDRPGRYPSPIRNGFGDAPTRMALEQPIPVEPGRIRLVQQVWVVWSLK
jgi:uncharacterized protein YggE